MPKQTTKPPTYRLTLTQPAVAAAIGLTGSKALFRTPKIGVPRSDGKIDVGISYNLLDQLQTAALPKENLSDTLLRLYPSPKEST